MWTARVSGAQAGASGGDKRLVYLQFSPLAYFPEAVGPEGEAGASYNPCPTHSKHLPPFSIACA